jgi:hypothetical protein
MASDLTREDLERMRNARRIELREHIGAPIGVAWARPGVIADLDELAYDRERLIDLVEELATESHWVYTRLLLEGPLVRTTDEVERALAFGNLVRALLPKEGDDGE